MAQRDSAALLQQIREQKKKQLRVAGRALGQLSRADDDGKVEMTETTIYVGLNDSETRKQKYETEEYVAKLKEVCRDHRAAFSVAVEEGGYYHEDGEYTEERSLVLVLIDTDRETVRKIAEDLCVFFHQESVLITEDCIRGSFIQVKAPGAE